ncbi:TnpV protein [Anaeromassilibacillus sp. An172]|uniref:TnpV protein n=1 Tax=Anaeromassilibacillus sp. An172 TaxID=1965570 RepID=UPI000B39C958|nr:TnpV protein [Anaeromassilibacillus sp. An172]OUP76254.1 TnpV protein [Anaeromassilibacillus sp. An172]
MKSLFEQFGGAYHKESNYLIPNLTLSASEEMDIGIYGQQHLQYLQKYRRLTYINLLTSGKLYKYLSEIDNQAHERFLRIVKQVKQMQGITEQLKENNPIEWTRKVNCIRQQAEETVLRELIYS